jgi:hypothetical protein
VPLSVFAALFGPPSQFIFVISLLVGLGLLGYGTGMAWYGGESEINRRRSLDAVTPWNSLPSKRHGKAVAFLWGRYGSDRGQQELIEWLPSVWEYLPPFRQSQAYAYIVSCNVAAELKPQLDRIERKVNEAQMIAGFAAYQASHHRH